MNVYLLCGLPGSGKTTWAKMFIGEHPQTFRVCKDDIRQMLYGEYKFVKEDEGLVQSIAQNAISDLLSNKSDVIIDETCIKKSVRFNYLNMLQSDYDDCCMTLVEFPLLSKDTLLSRRSTDLRGYSKEYWGDVLEGMIKSFEPSDCEEWKQYKKVIKVNRND